MAGFFQKILQRFTNPEIDWDDLEAALIAGDLGPKLVMEIAEELKDKQKTLHGQDIIDVTKKHIRSILPPAMPPPLAIPGRPKVILVLGVNGVGKTTSVAKLGNLLKKRGHKVLLAAADTFRAAAVEQLELWSQRIDVPLVKGPPNGDPSAVCFDAYTSAITNKADYVLCDTAGRLHTRHNLMEELRKIRRTLAKKDESAPHEVYLVVDATTGSNALQQAREFQKAVPITGLIVTKLDGSGKGGIVVPIYQELKIPPRFIGTGEGVDDLSPFNVGQFLDELL